MLVGNNLLMRCGDQCVLVRCANVIAYKTFAYHKYNTNNKVLGFLLLLLLAKGLARMLILNIKNISPFFHFNDVN